MQKDHVALGNWVDKSTGEAKTSVAPISQGVSKTSGTAYQITDTNNTAIIDGTYPVGTILQSSTTFTTNAPAPTPFAKKTGTSTETPPSNEA